MSKAIRSFVAVLAVLSFGVQAQDGGQRAGLDDLINMRPDQVSHRESLSPVREAALAQTAQTLGYQRGFGERSKEIAAALNAMGAQLDRKWEFNSLMMGAGFLPPAIDEVRGAAAIDGRTFRVADVVWRIFEDARPVLVAPTWRDWLLLGLDPGAKAGLPDHESQLPKDDAERAFWKAELNKAYDAGRSNAQAIFEANQATLERTYLGMRRFYKLHEAGVVSAPEVVANAEVIDKDDPNTILVGATVWRITKPAVFVTDYARWKPLGQ